jgi:hypothetical protein
MNEYQKVGDDKQVDYYRSEIAKTSQSTKRRAFEKFALAALGSIPWVGGFISAAISLKTEEGSIRQNNIQSQWLDEHEIKMKRLGETINDIGQRFENLGQQVDERIQSESYLDIVRKSFRSWDKADTDEKRKYIANLISNAAGTRLCSDDIIRLFIDWLNLYHEAHFSVIRKIFRDPGCSRYDIWMSIHGELVREDSAEADLFKFLIRDLSTGGVIRQARDTTEDGRFLKKRPAKRSVQTSRTMESAFEDSKPYILTELGKQFVHYTMTELVPRIDTKEA